MKVALVHDYIKEYGGAERVLEALHTHFPHATVFTLVYLPSFLGPHQERFRQWNIKTSILQYLPFKEKFISIFRLFAPFLFMQFDLSEFDVVIVSATGAYLPNLINKKRAVHICYCHTPPRYLYGYATARNWKKNIFFRIAAEMVNSILRVIDYKSAQKVDYFVANSKEVASRIKKFYRRDAAIIYPPVIDTNRKVPQKVQKKEFFLAGGRLARPKHIDLIIQACNALQMPLVVFGKSFAGYGEELKQLAGATVTFMNEISDAEKGVLMQQAKGFIFAGEDEDFGMIVVEAMSYGTPVIAYRSGGVKESIIESKTGIFFDELTQESLVAALKKFSTMHFSAQLSMEQAKKFSVKNFTQGIENIIKKGTQAK